MNQAIENILTRRSVRSFTDRPISEEDLELITRAAVYAPSGMNRQTWQFTVLTNREDIRSFMGAIAKELDRKGYDGYDPVVLIIPSNEKDSQWGKEDNACALENIFLAANSLGIGSVWLNQLQGISEEPAIRDFLKKWGVPDSHVVYGMAALGYAKEQPPQHVIKTGKVNVIR